MKACDNPECEYHIDVPREVLEQGTLRLAPKALPWVSIPWASNGPVASTIEPPRIIHIHKHRYANGMKWWEEHAFFLCDGCHKDAGY